MNRTSRVSRRRRFRQQRGLGHTVGSGLQTSLMAVHSDSSGQQCLRETAAAGTEPHASIRRCWPKGARICGPVGACPQKETAQAARHFLEAKLHTNCWARARRCSGAVCTCIRRGALRSHCVCEGGTHRTGGSESCWSTIVGGRKFRHTQM